MKKLIVAALLVVGLSTFAQVENQEKEGKEPMEKIASLGEMVAFKHEGFWKPMDTLRDKHELESEWQSGNARWKTW